MTAILDDLSTISAAIRLNPADDVGVARRRIPVGAAVGLNDLIANQLVPRGHKVALHAIPAGSPVRKFGQVIGLASADIAAGDHVHLHNLAMTESAPDHRSPNAVADDDILPPDQRRTFMGFDRGAGGSARETSSVS